MPYLSGLPNPAINKIMQNHMSLFMNFLDTQCIRLSHWFVGSPNLSPIENILSWVAERLAYHSSPANTIDEVWHKLEVAWNELPFSVIQVQFDSMPNRVRTVFAGSVTAVSINFAPL
ncbi:hypothetical protein TNCV_2135551 [Trichonephila clavipes]|nr:hypothetical protein TNCV_2135551 [Trichonephila clavipes]